MRNLKRALSLTLASVMLLGMMVVGSSAAAGYDDVSETDNVEAIEVLQAIEVMVGDERGFGPERPVNRAEMAVVMGKLLSLDYNYYTATCPFDDVYDWARGWVGACAANGIVSGRGEGVYDPGATVTAVEAASMLMRALGYFKYQNDYADGFEVSTVRQGTKIGIFNGVGSSATEPMTRNQVAQMVLNALQSAVVEPDGNTINLTTPDGTVYTGKVNYVSVTSAKSFATAISRTQATSVGSQNDGWIVELGERLYDGKLKLTDTTDDFGRPSRYWEYDAKEIGTYVKEELIRQEYTVKVTGRTLHDLLGSTILKDYDLDVYIDGVDDPAINTAVFGANSLVRNNENGVGKTGKGVLTQVFVDPDEGSNGLITIAIINTYLAIADEDFDDRTDDLDITVYGIEPISGYPNLYEKTASIGTKAAGPTDESSAFKLETEDFPSIVDAKDGDAYLVTVADGKVQTIAKPEIISGTQITSFKQADWIVTGGTQYDFASAAEFEMDTLYDYTATDNAVINLKDITYNVYLDKYGYAIGVEEVERVENYVFITGVDTNTVNRYAVQADASAIFVDGTMDAIKVDMKAARDLTNQATYRALTGADADEEIANVKGGSLVNKWFSYTVGNDGVYEVVLVGDDNDVENNGARAGQFRTLNKKDNNINNTASAPYYALGTAAHGVDEIGPKSIALRGADEAKSAYYSVYGDDQSVYITAELETIIDANGSNEYQVNIISGVDNVVTGIDNASIDVWDKATAKTRGDSKIVANVTAYGSYVLYDDDGDIIAAVVVGEDSGAVTNLVYTHKSKIESETDNNAADSRATVKGDYTWTRKVVSNGEEVLLTEVGSGLSKLKSMLPNTWYVVKYNAKGEVKNVYPAWDTAQYAYGYKGLIDTQPADATLEEKTRTEDQYVNDIEELNTATNENNLVLYEVGQYNTGKTTPVSSITRNAYDAKAVGTITWLGGPNNPENVRMSGKPYVDNHTLFITTQTNSGVHRGFRVADDVKTVFIQTNNREETTLFESGYSRLEKVIDRLHDHAEYGRFATAAEQNNYHYEISAVMENGKASVVVIRDLNNAGATWGTVDRNRELRLYGNLFTSPTTVTGASNAVVTVGDKEIEPTGIGTDRYGSYTIYSIPQGATVSIVDYDIDNVDPAFTYMTNMPYGDLNVRTLNRTITFTMPAYDAWIDGGRGTSFVQDIIGKTDKDEASLTGKTVTFNGQPDGDSLDDQTYGSRINIVITQTPARAASITLVDGETYTVTLGDPKSTWTGKATTNADGNVQLSFTYRLTGNDIRNGEVVVYSIVAANGGATDPTDPVDPSNPVAVTGVTLNKTSASIAVGAKETLTATVAPANATNKNVTWSTSDASVATVTNGVVTGVKAGTATITVTTVDGSKTASCDVTVTSGGTITPPGSDIPNAPGAQTKTDGTIDLLYDGIENTTNPYTTKAAVAAALSAELGVTVAADNINDAMTSVSYVDKDGKIQTKTINAAQPVYKVILNGTVIGYTVSSGTTIVTEAVTADDKYISGTDAATSALTYTAGTKTLSGLTASQENVLYAAVKIGGLGDAASDEATYYAPGADTNVAPETVDGTNCWIPAGSTLTITSDVARADGYQALVVNGVVDESTVRTTVTGGGAPTWTFVAAANKANANKEITVNPAAVVDVQFEGASEGYYSNGQHVYFSAERVPAGKYLASGKSAAVASMTSNNVTALTAGPNAGQYTDYTVVVADATKGILDLHPAVSVTFGSNEDAVKFAGTNTSIGTITNANYVPKGSSLEVTGKANNTWYDLKADTTGITVNSTKTAPAATGKGVWVVTITDTVAADPFEATLTGGSIEVSTTGTGLGATSDPATGKRNQSVVLNGVDLSSATIAGKGSTGTMTATVDPARNNVTVKVESTAAVTGTAGDTVATFVVTVGSRSVEVTVAIAP